MRTTRWIVVAALATLVPACTDDRPVGEPPPDPAPIETRAPAPDVSPAASPDPLGTRVRLREVAAGFERPLLVTHAGDGSGRLFVAEQGGMIFAVTRGEREPFLDLTGLTETSGEQGLLGLAFHPDFDANGRFFVDYIDSDGNTVVAEYGDGAPDSGRVLLRVEQPFANHNGGHLAFGPDGYLYIGTGDGGSGGDPQGHGQRTDSLLGKLLRIDVDSGNPYGIPPDNPFAAEEGRPEIWAYGLRNPWRFSFDRDTDDLWIADVGQDGREEVNVERAGAGGGLNYGWNIMEGRACFLEEDCDRDALVLPVAEYAHEFGCSITGGHVYRGRRFPQIEGGYYFSDYCSGRVWVIDASMDRRQRPVELLATGLQVASFGEDESGEIYVTDAGSGTIYRLEARD